MAKRDFLRQIPSKIHNRVASYIMDMFNGYALKLRAISIFTDGKFEEL